MQQNKIIASKTSETGTRKSFITAYRHRNFARMCGMLLLLSGFGAQVTVDATVAHADSAANVVVQLAYQHLGAPYGARGFNCVTFVQYIFRSAGVSVPQIGGLGALYSTGSPVSEGTLAPGDLVFYQNTYSAGLSHVAIYVGNGNMIGADNASVGVHLDSMSSSYWAARYDGARRYIGSGVQASAPQSVVSTHQAVTYQSGSKKSVTSPSEQATVNPATPTATSVTQSQPVKLAAAISANTMKVDKTSAAVSTTQLQQAAGGGIALAVITMLIAYGAGKFLRKTSKTQNVL